MTPVLPLPRLLFGAGSLADLPCELAQLGVERPLLISDRGLERAGAVARLTALVPNGRADFLDVPENPTAAGVDGAYAIYVARNCDGVIALGGGSVIDTAKIVIALGRGGPTCAADLVGKPERIPLNVIPLIAIPTTVGTGSESSPAAGLHLLAGAPLIGTRSPRLVPRVAILDPDLARTLPRRLIAATGVDALAHCIEGYFAEPANPVIDALALDGIGRVFADLRAALEPGGDDARASLMAAAFAGGAAIHKGLGPAHAIATVCGDQHLHHGALIAAALPLTVALVARHAPAKAARVAAAIGVASAADIAPALAALVRDLGLPATYLAAGYVARTADALAEDMRASPFNRTSPYTPSHAEYRAFAEELTCA